MPDLPTWLERVPCILGSLQEPNTPPFLDRPAIEKLFGLRRRQAINLMRRFGGYQVGRTFLVSTEAVIQFLNSETVDRDMEKVQAQKQRVADFLSQARLALSLPTISLAPSAKPSQITFEGLPPGIDITPNQLSIHFETGTELLEKLFSLSQALANDFETFEKALAQRGSRV